MIDNPPPFYFLSLGAKDEDRCSWKIFGASSPIMSSNQSHSSLGSLEGSHNVRSDIAASVQILLLDAARALPHGLTNVGGAAVNETLLFKKKKKTERHATG